MIGATTQRPARTKGNATMRKSLFAALGLAVALAVSGPVMGVSTASAATHTMMKHHHHHKRHHHFHKRHHHKKVMHKKM